MTPEERFGTLINFKGFGNPRGRRKICFIGIEEASGFSDIQTDLLDQNIINDYGNEIKIELPHNYFEYIANWNRENAPSRYTKVYEYMAKFINNITPNITEAEILDNLFTENGLAFQMNLYPLGRENTREITIDFTEPERFNLNSYEDYRRRVMEERFPLLRDFWVNNNDNFAITICFGSDYWEDYKNLFGIVREADRNNDYYKYYRNERILLTPFFKSGNGALNNDLMLELFEVIREEQIHL